MVFFVHLFTYSLIISANSAKVGPLAGSAHLRKAGPLVEGTSCWLKRHVPFKLLEEIAQYILDSLVPAAPFSRKLVKRYSCAFPT